MADLMCGMGGTSTGAARAAAKRGITLDLVVLNHWQVAIESHRRAFPDAIHYCQDIAAVRPMWAVPGGHLDLLAASPSCTHHSRARGGRPTSDQQRADPWHVAEWCTQLQVDRLFIENVPEFEDWGPVDAETGRPVATKRGAYFRAWIRALQATGLRLWWGVLNAADYGDATTRYRFILLGRRGRRQIGPPAPTHSRDGARDLFGGGSRRWRAARDVIDWSVKGRSIYGRAKPLAPNTLRRTRAGLVKLGGAAAAPWLPRLDAEIARAEAYKALDQAGRRAWRLAWRQQEQARAEAAGPADAPTAPGPFTIANRRNCVARELAEPIGTVTGSGNIMLIEPVAGGVFLLGQQSGSAARPVEAPMMAIATGGAIAMIEPFLAPYYGRGSGTTGKSAGLPMDTITGTARLAVVEPVGIDPILVQTDQTGGHGAYVRSPRQPLPTAVTKRSLVIVEPIADHAYDILLRMVRNDELAAASNLDIRHVAGTSAEVTKQIGNAVPGGLAEACIGALMDAR